MDAMLRFDLYVGHTMACGRVLPANAVRTVIKDALYDAGVRNYTLSSAEGCWVDGEERTTVITVLEPYTPSITMLAKRYKAIARHLATSLHQECVLVTYTGTHGAFVEVAEEN